jgi:sulfur carrier protein
MQVIINGENRELPAECTVSQMLGELELTGRRVAVEVNRELVTRSLHNITQLNAGDKVEIVTLVGGG